MTSPYAGRSFVFDIETNGLLDVVTTMHCAVAIDDDTGEVLDFGPGRLQEFLELYVHAKTLIGHNIIGYDCAVLEKLYGLSIPPASKLIDTVNLAKLCFSDIKATDMGLAKKWRLYSEASAKHEDKRTSPAEGTCGPPKDIGPYRGTKPLEFPGQFIGMHSLEAWGYRMGAERKGDYSKECKAAGIDPWAAWSPEMHAYMIQDGIVNRQLYHYLLKELTDTKAVLLEMRVQRLCSKIERNGWPLNVRAAEALYMALSAEREALSQSLRALFPPWTKKLEDFIPKRANKAKGYLPGVPVPRSETIEFNPGSRDHIVNRLIAKYKWSPTAFTKDGKAQVDDEILQRLPYPEAKALARFFVIQKRIGQLAEGPQAWLKVVTAEGKVHGRYNTNGASTGRATHYKPNIAQVPSVGAPFGRDCRALFHVPAGWLQLGADQAGLELRCLGSFLAGFDGGAYIQTVLFGDIHWENAKALFNLPDDTERYGPPDDNGKPTAIPEHEKYRGVAKTFIYAFLYGAGDGKLGSIVGKGSREGATLRARFLKKFPALAKLIAYVKHAAKKGWLKGLDGRKLPIRSEHSALNTLLQSAGAIICKQWIVDAEDALVAAGFKHGWDGDFVFLGWIHDEVQLAVRKGLEDRIATILVETARTAGAPFPSWKCPTDGDTKVGANWAECH